MAPKRKHTAAQKAPRKTEAGRKRTAAQKLTENSKAGRGKRDPQKIRDASNKPKKENPESQMAYYRKVIMRYSMLLLMCPLQESEAKQMASLANGGLNGRKGRPIKPEH